ncbi:hypothetical protein DP44_5779 [Burkholderia pseudomallei]|nr:hypothetical protein DP44_5779 [Burkholderia pseudomallei]
MRCRCGVDAVSMRCRCGVDAVSMWRRCGVDVVSMWCRCGVDVVSMWRRCGVGAGPARFGPRPRACAATRGRAACQSAARYTCAKRFACTTP